MVLDFPFSRNEEVAAERPRIWGADVESAESVERERLASMCESEGVFDGRPFCARREPVWGAVMVVVDVVDVGLDEDDDSRFLFTMLDRPVEAEGGRLWQQANTRTRRRAGERRRAVSWRRKSTR